MPLGDMAVTRDDVNAFWDRQDWDLSLPSNAGLSNCVFCFLKGLANLQHICQQLEQAATSDVPGFGPLAGTPCDLAWWNRIEREYGRDLLAEGRKVRGNSTRYRVLRDR